ncbi:MAG TPA: YdcF family protein [Terriglobia bacterium]|nr:YdcF family protein [Terriglobia bacterium]
MDQSEIDTLAKKIWDYHHMNQPIEKAGCIVALGSNDIRVADRAAELYREGWAPLVIFSGGKGNLTSTWERPEAEVFAERPMAMGVPQEKILAENESTNTGENVAFVKKLLAEHRHHPAKIIVVQKPYMKRRTFATFKQLWPEQEFVVTSPQIAFEDYPNAELPRDLTINIMVGDLQRIRLYPAKGFQIYQDIPRDVQDAYHKLIALGYTNWLVAEEGPFLNDRT